ncbi:uncharacterized protein LOC129759525 [Uranotaenia lowii]|uniref:uncharacterized protein LOC129759525 n=1 Tax=Uranotaenia lowii TaxID=190385 RepID=UPI002478F951|nr:uncharacterized protein LOC129759525 [Uranotaenia lowii]
MEFEEVEMEEDYLIEGDISDASPVKTSHEPAPKVARLVPKSEPSTSGRKIPIIRSAGAVVTPVRTAVRKPVQASPSSKIGVAFEREMPKRPENDVHNSRITNIEEQLDAILDNLVKRDEDIAYIRKNIAYTERFMKKKIRAWKRKHFERPLDEGQPEPKRLNLVTFPIPDQEYLERLEEALEEDEDVKMDLTALFYLAPQESAYKFFRRNLKNLFSNTSRYFWTGRLSNKSHDFPNRKPARTLNTIKLLLKCGEDVFDTASADALANECSIALRSVNYMQHKNLKADI